MAQHRHKKYLRKKKKKKGKSLVIKRYFLMDFIVLLIQIVSDPDQLEHLKMHKYRKDSLNSQFYFLLDSRQREV